MSQDKKPKVDFFKAEDFAIICTRQEIADRANQVLAERAQVVWADHDTHLVKTLHYAQPSSATHTALLINVQEIEIEKECVEHEPISAHTIKSKSYGYSDIVVTSTCKNCGKELKAKWEPIHE